MRALFRERPAKPQAASLAVFRLRLGGALPGRSPHRHHGGSSAMPDPLLLLKASTLAALLAAAGVLLCGLLGRGRREACLAAGGAAGVGLAFFAGAWLVGGLPQW